jgi:hypothetical protein
VRFDIPPKAIEWVNEFADWWNRIALDHPPVIQEIYEQKRRAKGNNELKNTHKVLTRDRSVFRIFECKTIK